MDVEAISTQAQETAPVCSTSHADQKDYRNQVTMESGGVIEMDDPGYVENDDVKDSMAEGYF